MTLLTLLGCNSFKKGEGDLLYRIHADKSGPTIKEGEVAEITALEKTEEDSVIWNSLDYDRTALVRRIKSVFKGDLFEALGMLSEGDSATVKINIDSMVAKMGRVKPQNTKGNYLVYTIKINKVIPKTNLSDSLYDIKVDQFLEARLKQIKNKEASKIRDYLHSKKIKTSTTASGLQYTIIRNGTGAKPGKSDTLKVHYTGTFMSGKVFDTTYPDVAKKAGLLVASGEPLAISTESQMPVKGFEEALKLFPKGTTATLIIPSKLAYGEQGYQLIQSYTPLVYTINIVDIVQPGVKSRIAEGAAMPGFTLYRLNNGSPFTKNDMLKGKSIFILFDSNCDHCQHEVQAIGKHYSAFKNVNLYLVSIENKEPILKFMASYGKLLNNKKNVTILQDRDRQFISSFQATAYPAIYTYSDKNELLKYFGGQSDIKEIIKAIKQ